MDFSLHLVQNFHGGLGLVDGGVGGVFKLLGDPHVFVLPGHPVGGVQAGLDAGADVPVVMDQNQLRPVGLDELPPFFTDGVGHNDADLVPLHRPHQGQADALVAAGGLHDNGVRGQNPPGLRVQDHVAGGAGFNGAADVDPFVFYQHIGRARRHHAGEPDERGVS